MYFFRLKDEDDDGPIEFLQLKKYRKIGSVVSSNYLLRKLNPELYTQCYIIETFT